MCLMHASQHVRHAQHAQHAQRILNAMLGELSVELSLWGGGVWSRVPRQVHTLYCII